MINANFTYNVLTDKRDDWVRSAVDACKKLGFEYVISRHPAEKGDFSEYNVTDDSMYNAIWNGSLFISRFGSGIIESIAMGRPVVYYNPHNEQVDKFKYPDGAYYIANTQNELMQSILDTYATRENLEKNWDRFLTLHAGFNPENPDCDRLLKCCNLSVFLMKYNAKILGNFFRKIFNKLIIYFSVILLFPLAQLSLPLAQLSLPVLPLFLFHNGEKFVNYFEIRINFLQIHKNQLSI